VIPQPRKKRQTSIRPDCVDFCSTLPVLGHGPAPLHNFGAAAHENPD
jgi:hypothetical protein